MLRRSMLGALVAWTACSDAADPADWMSRLEDSRGLAELSIPGTHDAGARFEPYPGLAKTQELTIAEQLEAGVRFFDVRCRHFEDRFAIYHGAIDQDQSYDQVLATMFAFLDAHPDEVLIVSVQEESSPFRVTRSFEVTFAEYIAQAPERWSLAATLPRLGDVRGKLVLLRRFATTAATAAPMGIDASAWPDNSLFSLDNAASLRIQDTYVVDDNDAKWALITQLLDEARAGSASTLFLNFTSGKRDIDGLSNITSVSDDINRRLDALLADPANRRARLGMLVMDHVTTARVQAVIATNAP